MDTISNMTSIDAHSNSLPFWPNKVYEQWKGSAMKRQNVHSVSLYVLVREWEPCASGNHTSWNHVTRGPMTAETLIQTACLSAQIKFMNNEKTERNFLYMLRASREWEWEPCESVCLVEIVLMETMLPKGTLFRLNCHIFVTTIDFQKLNWIVAAEAVPSRKELKEGNYSWKCGIQIQFITNGHCRYNYYSLYLLNPSILCMDITEKI